MLHQLAEGILLFPKGFLSDFYFPEIVLNTPTSCTLPQGDWPLLS